VMGRPLSQDFRNALHKMTDLGIIDVWQNEVSAARQNTDRIDLLFFKLRDECEMGNSAEFLDAIESLRKTLEGEILAEKTSEDKE